MNIKLSTLTEAMDSVLEEATQEYDKATGEIHFIYDGMVDGEINQELEEYICESDDFIALPEKYEINDYAKLDVLDMEETDTTDYEAAARYWTDRDAKVNKMPLAELMLHMENFVKAHNTCALATGSDGFVRCTPIEYNYVKGAFYMFSEGGLKFMALRDNKNVSMAIYDEYSGFDNLGGVQIQGIAELIPAGTDEYFQVMDHKKLPRDAFDKMERPMHLIKVTPQSMDYLNSELKKLGHDTRQHIDL